MPTLANISINNHAAVATTFSVESSGSNNQGVFVWRNRTSAVPVRYDAISYSNKRSRGSPLIVHHYKIISPVTDTPSGGLERQVAQVMADVRIYVPDSATLTLRQNFIAYVKNMMNHATVSPVVVDSESYY